MDIESFVFTLVVGLLSGVMLGVFGREIFSAFATAVRRIYGKPRYLRAYRKPYGELHHKAANAE